jgi:photosystem II stability/assembly factor-like uncharacterized protein
MKKSTLLLFTALCTLNFALAQQYGWTNISANIPGNPDLSDVFFVSDDKGWIISSSHAEIYHTTDGGETFEVQTTQYTCNAVHMLNENEGYAGGASGFIYKTTNGGTNWNFHGTMVANLADISFPPTGDTGYSCGIDGNIYRIDSKSVTKMTSNFNSDASDVSFPITNSEGWVVAGDVIRHFNNNVWNGDQDYPSGYYVGLDMVDTQNGWAVGSNGIIIHTTDGRNWFEQTNPDSQNRTLYVVYFLNINEGWTIGSAGIILHTDNGGTTWAVEADGLTTNSLTGVHFTSPTNGYAVGNGKTFLKYTEIPTGVGVGQELETLKFEIYPNPATEKFQVSGYGLQVENAEIEICDLNGRKLLEKQIPARPTGGPAGNETVEIDVSNLKNGIYFFKFSTEKGDATKKLIIQK